MTDSIYFTVNLIHNQHDFLDMHLYRQSRSCNLPSSVPIPYYMLGNYHTFQRWTLQIHCRLSLDFSGITEWALICTSVCIDFCIPILLSLLHRLFFPMSQFWPQMHFDFSHFIWFTSQSPQSSLMTHSVHGSIIVDDFERVFRVSYNTNDSYSKLWEINTLLRRQIKYWTFKIFIDTIKINIPCHSRASIFWTTFVITISGVVIIFIVFG